MFRRTFLGVLCTTLSACAHINSEFECKAGKGVGCKSVSEVNHMVSEGKLGSREEPAATQNFSLETQGNTLGVASTSLQRVWIAPYTDVNGTIHDARVIHITVPREIKNLESSQASYFGY